MSTEPQVPPATAEVRFEARRPGRGGRRPPAPWRMIFVTGLFAATVYAATEGLLRLAVDAPPPARPTAGAPAPARASVPTPASQVPQPAADGAPQGESAPASGATPAPGSTPAPDGAGATGTRADAAAAGDDADTNEEQPAEGPRRAAPPKASDEEAPEFRESADNNISLPVDI